MADDGAEQSASAFERFRELARKLTQVPKREIDAEQAKEKERKERERRD